MYNPFTVDPSLGARACYLRYHPTSRSYLYLVVLENCTIIEQDAHIELLLRRRHVCRVVQLAGGSI